MLISAGLAVRMMATRTALAAHGGQPGSLVPGDARIARVRAEGVRGILAYQVDAAEHDRRRKAGLGAVTRLEWLDTLMAMPVGLPVPLQSMTITEQKTMQRLPPGCLDYRQSGVIRRLARPIGMYLVIVDDADWRRGLVRSGAYIGCTRILAVPPTVAGLDEAALEADYWGVGLMISGRPLSSSRVIVPPQRFVPTVYTAASWRFCEEMYRQAVVTAGAEQ
ncbi:MAG: hypothetical protein ABSA93_40155 [Streptosporangiaceae bacterium]